MNQNENQLKVLLYYLNQSNGSNPQSMQLLNQFNQPGATMNSLVLMQYQELLRNMQRIQMVQGQANGSIQNSIKEQIAKDSNGALISVNNNMLESKTGREEKTKCEEEVLESELPPQNKVKKIF